MRLRIIESGLSPELTGDLNGVDAGRPPPGLFVAGAMDRPVMRAAERDGEFVARFAAERPWLQVTKMMRIGLFAAAYEARLLGNVAKVLRLAIATRCSNREDTLVDALRSSRIGAFGDGNLGIVKQAVQRVRECLWLVLDEEVSPGDSFDSLAAQRCRHNGFPHGHGLDDFETG